MFHAFLLTIRAFLREVRGSVYHIAVIVLSAGIALLLPSGAKHFLAFWARVEHDKLSLVAIEIIVAVLLIACFGFIRRSLCDRILAAAATGAGLVSFFPRRARRARHGVRPSSERVRAGPPCWTAPAPILHCYERFARGVGLG